ncbi:MAG: LPS export ABC transporter periplasmic protein LptC [Crocinitomicaceae bacterium]|nr:LPS export ABC transporter periplasmic protein LptC [Crocinitomicaceae bacterium]MCF8443657.1 LPS export ABC transporter periplasmic protein LptC [Crocinitomicaceae bacterium]
MLLYQLNRFRLPLLFVGVCLSSCVNDLDEIEKVTFNEKTPNEVIQDLDVIYLDSGKAKIEVISKITEIERNQESITKLKDKVQVNFYSSKGEIVSVLTALYGEINFTKGEMFVQDSVKLYNIKKKQSLETERLDWRQKDSLIYTTSKVTVKTPEAILYGTGIKTKQDFTYYQFLKPKGKIDLKKSNLKLDE